MHYLLEVAKEVDKSHPHLGNLAAVAMLAIKAKKFLLVVSPRGCGKSRVSSFVGLSYREVSLQDRLSIAGLAKLVDELNGFQGVLVVDDIGKTQTPYARVSTLTTIAELIYSHYCISHLSGTHFEIKDFYGSALVNIQPVLLREVIRSDEWEASMMDKSIRYYHLFRPTNPNPLPPTLKLEWGIDISKVEVPNLKGTLANKLKKICESQWGLARLKEHVSDLLRASAAFDERRDVGQGDYKLLIKLLTPLALESVVCDKLELESQRYLNSNTLALLTEFVTYGQFTLSQLCQDYKISESRAYQIMQKMEKDWGIVKKNPTTFAPSDSLKEKLKGVGL